MVNHTFEKLFIMFKTSGRTQGIILKPTTLQKFYLNSECRTKFLHTMREIISISDTRHNISDLHQSWISEDEIIICPIIDLAQIIG